MNDEEIAFPDLGTSEIEQLLPLGTTRSVEVGDYLYHQGDATYDFYVMLSGAVEIFLVTDGEEQVIVRHGAGRFLGELNLLTGSRVLVSARVTEAGEVLVVPRDSLRHVIATSPNLSDIILKAFLERRTVLLTGAAPAIRVIGSRFSPDSLHVREFLSRTRIPHQWFDPDRDSEVEAILREFQVKPEDMPVVIATGSLLRNATPGTIADYLGITVDSLPSRCFDLVVVGAGPSGLAASVYGASEGLRTLTLEQTALGGQAGSSSRIENYMGFPTGISGTDLMSRGLIQAEKFGASMTSPCAVTSLHERGGHLVLTLSDGSEVAGRAVIAATGARYRQLDADGLDRFEGNVYYAATDMESRLCTECPAVVVGGGNSAGQAAMFLAETCSSVTIVIRASDLGKDMSRYLVDRIEDHPRIKVETGAVVTRLEGEKELESLQLKTGNGEISVPCTALFSFIGAEPGSDWLSGCASLDDKGFILTDRALDPEELGDTWEALDREPLPYETSHPGLFAVGDVRSGSTKRVATAVGEGSGAVRSVHEYLSFSH